MASIPHRPDIQTLQWLSREYHDLNGSYYETLETPPSALEFSRLINISRPVVIKGKPDEAYRFKIPALTRWTDEYLIERMADREMSVAVTPNGRADAVTPGPDNKLYFVEPYTQRMTMRDFLSSLCDSSDEAILPECNQEIHYLQSQNGNMYSTQYFKGTPSQKPDFSEFEILRADVPSEISWCSEAFGRHPEAVNLWIGDSRSVTSIHSDPYENIYTVVRGIKHFTLFPPPEGWCLQERNYSHATYTRSSPTSPLNLTPSSPATTPSIRWSSIANPHLSETLPSDAHPIHISLHAGETLYLPAGWWHHVRQGGGEDTYGGKTIAVNWWYDFEGRGMGWVWLEFLRGGDVPDGNNDHEMARSN